MIDAMGARLNGRACTMLLSRDWADDSSFRSCRSEVAAVSAAAAAAVMSSRSISTSWALPSMLAAQRPSASCSRELTAASAWLQATLSTGSVHLQRVSSDVEGGVGVVGEEGKLGKDGLNESVGGAAAGSVLENSLNAKNEIGDERD